MTAGRRAVLLGLMLAALPMVAAPGQTPPAAPPTTPPAAAQAAPAEAPPEGAAPAAPEGAAPPSQTPPPPDPWLPGTRATLQVLDKVNARTASLEAPIGAPLRFHTLAIVVRSCAIRPPDRAADAAAFVDITDDSNAAPPFHAWMVQSAPAVSVYEHPLYDVTLAGCR